MEKLKLDNPKASLYPVPVTLVSCFDRECENIITISWTGILCSNPPIVYISVRPGRYSYQLLSESNRFCLNIPSVSMLKETDYCGNTSGKIVDKAHTCGFDFISLVDGYPRAIKQCKHHLFCEIINRIELGSHVAFVAEVKHEFVDEDCYLGNHQFDYSLIQPIAYCRKDYYSLSNKIGSYGKQTGG